MEDLFEELFRVVHRFKKLNVMSIVSGISSSELAIMGAILSKGENGKITTSELASLTRTLPPAVSRTLRGMEEKELVERSVDKKDRRNTYVALTPKGVERATEVREMMRSFGRSVMLQVNEEEMKQFISYLEHIYDVTEKEVETRKRQNREDQKGKGKENE